MIREFELALENLVFGAPAEQDLARSVIEQLEWAQTGGAGPGLAGLSTGKKWWHGLSRTPHD